VSPIASIENPSAKLSAHRCCLAMAEREAAFPRSVMRTNFARLRPSFCISLANRWTAWRDKPILSH
jgi:hypothetical protein